MIGIETKEQWSLRQLIDILQVKYLLYGFQILLGRSVILRSNTFNSLHLCFLYLHLVSLPIRRGKGAVWLHLYFVYSDKTLKISLCIDVSRYDVL